MKLVQYDEAVHKRQYQKEIQDYYLPEEQAIFSAVPLDALAISEISERINVLMVNEKYLVGFFVLDSSTDVQNYSLNPQAVLLRSFSTNHRYQRQGFAKQALEQIPQFIHEKLPNINEIVLGVNQVNQAAIALYLQNGFEDHGQRIKTEYGKLWILTQKLNR